MQFSEIFTAAALAGLALAAPVQLEGREEVTTWTVKTVITYTTVYPGQPAAPSPAALLQQAPKPEAPSTTQAPPPPPPATTTVVAAPVQTQAAPTEAKAPTPVTGNTAWSSISPEQCAGQTAVPGNFDSSPTWCGLAWIDEINIWRKAYGKSSLTWDSGLARVALTAAAKSGGNTGTFSHTNLQTSQARGENMAGGWSTVQKDSNGSNKGVTPFGHALVQGWLAEVPSDPQLQASGFTGIDQTFDPEYVYEMNNGVRDPGHHDIFLDNNYSKIGCAFVSNPGDAKNGGGIYVCDFE